MICGSDWSVSNISPSATSHSNMILEPVNLLGKVYLLLVLKGDKLVQVTVHVRLTFFFVFPPRILQNVVSWPVSAIS